MRSPPWRWRALLLLTLVVRAASAGLAGRSLEVWATRDDAEPMRVVATVVIGPRDPETGAWTPAVSLVGEALELGLALAPDDDDARSTSGHPPYLAVRLGGPGGPLTSTPLACAAAAAVTWGGEVRLEVVLDATGGESGGSWVGRRPVGVEPTSSAASHPPTPRRSPPSRPPWTPAPQTAPCPSGSTPGTTLAPGAPPRPTPPGGPTGRRRGHSWPARPCPARPRPSSPGPPGPRPRRDSTSLLHRSGQGAAAAREVGGGGAGGGGEPPPRGGGGGGGGRGPPPPGGGGGAASPSPPSPPPGVHSRQSAMIR